jgi:hypothetical protein
MDCGCSFCGRVFKKRADLLKHWDAPNGRCRPAFRARHRVSRTISDTKESEWEVIAEEENSELAGEEDETMDVDDNEDSAWETMDIDEPASDGAGAKSYLEYFPAAAMTASGTDTFLNRFHADEHADKRGEHPFYPFATRGEWQLASWLIRNNISVASTDEFLKLDYVRLITFKLPTISHYLAGEAHGPLLFHLQRSSQPGRNPA